MIGSVDSKMIPLVDLPARTGYGCKNRNPQLTVA